MAEMTIRLRYDPLTGKKDLIVTLRSDEDALPHEHEQRHRAMVEKLIHGGLLKPGELGQIVVEREQPESKAALSGNVEPETSRSSHSEES